MRALSDEMLAALASPAQCPNFQVTVSDPFDRPDVNAPGIESGDAGRSDIVRLADGTIIQCYVNQPGLGNPAQVYSRAVADATQAGGWGGYDLRKDGAEGQAGVALSVDPVSGAIARMYYQRLSDHAICYQDTVDGVTWTPEKVAALPEKSCWALCSGDMFQVYAAVDHVAGDHSEQDVIQYLYSDGLGWSDGALWTNPPVQISGLSSATVDHVDYIAMGALTRAGGSLCFSTMTQAGGAWTSPVAVHPLDDPSLGVSAPYPSLSYWDGTFHVAATHYDSGAATSSPITKTELWTSPDAVHWHLEQLVAGDFSNGARWDPAGDGWVVSDAGRVVLSEKATGAAAPAVEVSDDVLRVEVREPVSDVARGTVTLSNDQGQYSDAPWLKVGAKVDLSFGYDQSLVHTHSLYVDEVHAVSGGDDVPVERVELRVSNRGRMLGVAGPVERHHAGVSVLHLAADVAVAAGIGMPTAPATAQFSQIVDFFAQPVGSPHLVNLERLRSLYGFEWFVDEADALQLREPSASDQAVFSYGDGQQAQLHTHRIHRRRRPNHVRVTGQAVAGMPAPLAEASDIADVQEAGGVHYRHVTDRLLTSAAQCQIRADLEMRAAQRSGVAGEATFPLNPGHQVMDVISAAVESGGLTTTRIRVLTWIADMVTGEFEMGAGWRGCE